MIILPFTLSDAISGAFYKNVVKVSRCITVNQSRSTFGFVDTSVLGPLSCHVLSKLRQ